MSQPSPDPPPDGRVVLQEQPGRVCLTILPVGLRDHWNIWLRSGASVLALSFILSCGFCAGFAELLRFLEGESDPSALVCFIGLPGGCWLIGVGTIVHRLRCRGEFVIEGHCLTLRVIGPATAWRRDWGPGTVCSIQVKEGLRIRDAVGEVCLLAGREASVLWWVAAQLRRLLSCNESAPAAPGELRVTYDGTGVHGPIPGFLRVVPGRMMLRDPFAERLPLQFIADSGEELMRWLRRRLGLSGVYVSKEEIICRIQDDGATSLQVSQSGLEREFTIWCEDPEQLPRALERFWGANHDEGAVSSA
ncbi:MAG: hypothetical protein K2R98_32105 [Gemmataceae bacterium]|nr:hypothetical protein [Gemmataceae bacterium]